MALISIKRNVDLQPGLNAPAVFNCSQGDKGTTIMLGLMNGGNDYTVPSGVTITIRGSRSNGAVFTPVSATSSGSTVSFTLTEEMTDTAGPTLCEAVLEQGNNVLGTANFIINVEGSPMGADVPPVFTDAAWTWMLGKLTTETVPALGDDVISSIQGKVDKSQGSTNAKKFLRVNTSGNVSFESTDKTLSVADQIADAKKTGDQIRALDAEINGVATTLGGSISTLNGITTGLQSSKLNKNQGTSNAGKTMVVDSSGNIVPGDVPITIDDTLSIADAAADAKAAGDAIALKANASTIAPEFSDQNTYTAGSYVYKNGVLYKFTADHSGAWSDADVETVTVGGEVEGVKAGLNNFYEKNVATETDITSVIIDNSDGKSKVRSLIISVSPVQSGTGTPSFSNVRPITGVSNPTPQVNDVPIELALTDNEGNPYTIYSGTVDLINGTAHITGVTDIFTGESVYNYSSGTVPYVMCSMSYKTNANGYAVAISDQFANLGTNKENSFYVPSYSTPRVRLYSTQFTSKAATIAFLNENPVQFFYGLATPFDVQLKPNTLELENGENEVTFDGKTFSISFDVGLTKLIENVVEDMDIQSENASYGLSTDALLYVERIPTYYINPETVPTSFAEAEGYLDNKISQIPKNGKSFIYITDVHWDGNQKHSTDLINYIRKRTGIKKVLFGGDVYGNADNCYLAKRKAGLYLNQSKSAFGYDYIPTVGDHDYNTVNKPDGAEYFLPYEEIEELFVGDLERCGEYHFYDASEKLSNYAEVGTDDYNGAMAFFHTVYYVDDVRDKIRYITLNCGCGGSYGAMYNIFGTAGSTLLRLQADWLAETLMSTPTGYDVIILSHKGNTSYVGTNAVVINRIIYGVKRKSSNAYPHPSTDGGSNIDSWWPNTTSYDFSEAPDLGLVIALNGHSHADSLRFFGKLNGTDYSGNPAGSISSGSTIYQPDVVAGSEVETLQIPIITTACDSLGAAESTSPVMTADTVTEQCFDVITITDDAIVMTRFGAGNDRVLYLG